MSENDGLTCVFATRDGRRWSQLNQDGTAVFAWEFMAKLPPSDDNDIARLCLAARDWGITEGRRLQAIENANGRADDE